MEQLTRRRYIDANDLQVQLERKKAGIANQRYTEGWNDCMMRVKSMVSKAPAADVAPVVHARWVTRSDKGIISMTHPYMCSRCWRVEMNKEPYCNCGAQMDGGAK